MAQLDGGGVVEQGFWTWRRHDESVEECICEGLRIGAEMIIKLFTNKDFLTHVSIWVLAIVALVFFKTPGCCKCKCNEQQSKHSEIHMVETNVVMYSGRAITNLYSYEMYVCVTNRVGNP